MEYSIDLKQSNFINDIEEIYLTRDRSRQTGQPVTETEKKTNYEELLAVWLGYVVKHVFPML